MENKPKFKVGDTRIRKAISQCVEDMRGQFEKLYSVHHKDAIAWLEKQGENTTTLPKWKYKKDNAPLLRDSIILNKYGCVAKSPSGALVSDVWVIDYDELAKLPKEEFEKQGEHANFRNKIQIGDEVTRNEDGVLVNLSQLKRIAKKDEKQGETFTKKDVDDAYLKGISDAKHELEKQGTPAKLSEEEQNRFAKGVLTSCALSFIDYLDAQCMKVKYLNAMELVVGLLII